jgi:PBP1b-binding outer membrane lipoprotein LpoB
MKTSTKNNYLLVACLVFTLSGCANQWAPSMALNPSGYVPDVNLKGDALKTYHADVATCQKQIFQQYGDKSTSNNAITAVRLCLITKGYILLS